MRRIRSRLSYANVVGTLALFLVLSGGTAVALGGANTVFTDDVANDTQPASGGNPAGGLVAADLRAGSVGPSEVANNSLSGGDIIEDSLSIGPNAIADGSLNDEDIGQGTFVDFTGTIGTVAAHSCTVKLVTGVDAQGDHLLLTPNADTEDHDLIYQAEYRNFTDSMFIQACNPKAFPIDDGNTNFNLIVFDAE
jgi:hypothetical protein